MSSYAGVTTNVYTKDLTTEAILIEALPAGSSPPAFVGGVRIGQFIDGNDRWWRRDPNGPDEMAAEVEAYFLPFLDRMRPLEEQARWFGRASDKWGPTQLCLAATLYRMGEIEEACRSLAKPPRYWIRDRAQEIAALRRWLGCEDGCA